MISPLRASRLAAASAVLLAASSSAAAPESGAVSPAPSTPPAAERRIAFSVLYGPLLAGHIHVDETEQKIGDGNAWRFAADLRLSDRLALGAFVLSARAPLTGVDRRMSMDSLGVELVAHSGPADRPHLRLGATAAYQWEWVPGTVGAPTLLGPPSDHSTGLGVGGFVQCALPSGAVTLLAQAGFFSQLRGGSNGQGPLVRWTPLFHLGIGAEYGR